MSSIRLLPDHLINQIAAGEVVERPASVLKELLENALDADAKNLIIRFDNGGKRLLQVEDDGCGMAKEDALLALERHATSKITTFEDIASLKSLGFRGEALPSIASVSRLTLLTSHNGEEGVKIEVDRGRIQSVEPAFREKGTTIAVRDLFTGMPARRKFLRTTQTETKHLWRTLQGVVIPHPEIAFRVHAEGNLQGSYGVTGRIRDRLGALYGEEMIDHLEIEETALGSWRLTLLVAREHSPFHGSNLQFVFVNRRMMRDRLLSSLVYRRLKSLFPHALHPAYFLFIDLPPEEVDFNVHPAKLEVRFRDSSRLYGLFDRLVQGSVRNLTAPRPIVPPSPGGGGASFTPPPRPGPGEQRRMEEFFQQVKTAPWRYIGQAMESFLIFEEGESIMIVDQHAAHERILYESILDVMESDERRRQGLLPPITIPLTPADRVGIEEALPNLEHMGIKAELFGEDALLIRSHPIQMEREEVIPFIQIFISQGEKIAVEKRISASLACRSAIKIHRALGVEEANRLYTDLMRCRDPHHCPHGRPTILTLTRDSLFSHFRRT